MDKKIPINENCLYAILVKNGNSKNISSIIKLKNTVSCDWKSANEKVKNSKKFDNYGNYEIVIVSNEILDWNYIICKKNSDLKYSMNCCNELSKKYDEIFSFLIDVHSGNYRFIKMENRKIVRFFERDCNQVTGEFGKLLKEELEIVKENENHDYFYAVEVAKKVIRLNELSNENFDNNVIVGKRYYREIENYAELYAEPIKPNEDEKKSRIENKDLPF